MTPTIFIWYDDRIRLIAKPASYRELVAKARACFRIPFDIKIVVCFQEAFGPKEIGAGSNAALRVELDPLAYDSIADRESLHVEAWDGEVEWKAKEKRKRKRKERLLDDEDDDDIYDRASLRSDSLSWHGSSDDDYMDEIGTGTGWGWF